MHAILLSLQLATKDAIAQNIMAHDALYKRAILLDQFQEGLRKAGIFRLISMFPEEMSGLFVFQGVLSPEDVRAALYVEDEDDLNPENAIVFDFLLRYIDTLSEEGMCSNCDVL